MGNRRFAQFYARPIAARLQRNCKAAGQPERHSLSDTSEGTRNKGGIMPLVNVRLIEGVFTPEQKTEMIHQLTETMVRIEGENLRPVTWVIVDEVKSGDWGIGGKGLTAADVHALQGKAPAGVQG
jgi:4-oxalocrotonate tautomerase